MNQSPGDTWYYIRQGERSGPVGFSELKAKAREAALDPQLDMVWTDGMAEWQPAGGIEGLFEEPAPAEPPEAPAPAIAEEPEVEEPEPEVAAVGRDPKDIWYYTREGQRSGPVGFSDLRAKATEAALDPRLDMVWKQGMADWKPAGEIEGLFEKRAASEPEPEPLAPAAGTFTPPKQENLLEGMGMADDWPGARRRSYLFMTILFPFLWSFLFAFIGPLLGAQLGPEIMQYIGLAASILPIIAIIYFSLMRLVNLGMSRWWFLGNFVPVLNFWVGYRCFACPAGYAYHKKLDGAGIALAIFYWLSVVVAILVLAAVVALMFGAVDNPEIQDLLREPLRIIRERIGTP